MKFNNMKFLPCLLALAILFGCASRETPPGIYTYDVYQYKLESRDFASLKKEIKPENKNPSIVVMKFNDYWKLVDKLEQESFFSVYKYSSISCKVSKNTNLTDKESTGPCLYHYSNENLIIDLTANNYSKNQIAYTLSSKINDQSMPQQDHIKYNPGKEYFFFIYTNNPDNLLFIIYKNELNTPWDYYKNTPQGYTP